MVLRVPWYWSTVQLQQCHQPPRWHVADMGLLAQDSDSLCHSLLAAMLALSDVSFTSVLTLLYPQAWWMCFFFFTEEERQLQANNRDFNLQFEYAVSNQRMLFHADVVTDVAASASFLKCCFKGVNRTSCQLWLCKPGKHNPDEPSEVDCSESAWKMDSWRRSGSRKAWHSDFAHFQKTICESKLLQDQDPRPFNNRTWGEFSVEICLHLKQNMKGNVSVPQLLQWNHLCQEGFESGPCGFLPAFLPDS